MNEEVDEKAENASRHGRSAGGFTLIEMMIVIVILGILVTIAFPSYRNYVVRTERTDGKAALLDLQARQERFFFTRNTYTTSISELNFATELSDPSDPSSAAIGRSRDSHFTVAVSTPTVACPIVSCWQATATRRLAVDTDCAVLRLNSLGQRDSLTGAGTASPAVANCWGR